MTRKHTSVGGPIGLHRSSMHKTQFPCHNKIGNCTKTLETYFCIVLMQTECQQSAPFIQFLVVACIFQTTPHSAYLSAISVNYSHIYNPINALLSHSPTAKHGERQPPLPHLVPDPQAFFTQGGALRSRAISLLLQNEYAQVQRTENPWPGAQTFQPSGKDLNGWNIQPSRP